MGVREAMLNKFGPDVLKKSISANEFYGTVDAMTEAYQDLKKRVEAVETEKGIKPRHRVPAETRRI
jgi:hypothetical protein